MKNENRNTSDHWQTPKYFYDELDKEFNFDFDPCPIYFDKITPERDGLLIDWGKRNFVNCPYSKKLKDAFVKKAIDESKKGKLCVMLLPVRTSSVLFHDYIQPNAKEIRFVKGRIAFIGINNFGVKVFNETKNNRPMHDSMVVIFGK